MSHEQNLVVAARPPAPEQVLTLRRPHTAPTSPLRAWSAADELVLNDAELHALLDASPGRLLVVNDEFGALTCGFSSHDPVVWNDSALRRGAIETNLEGNGLPPIADRFVAGNEPPPGSFAAVVIRVPKSNALLAWQLDHIAAAVQPGTPVIGAAMARHISTSTRRAFERIGDAELSRATRKARLIRSIRGTVQIEPVAGNDRFVLADATVVVERPGVFSSGHLDAATALLLEHVQTSAEHVLDLGCGNGVISAVLARRDALAQFTLVDASDLAIEAASATWRANELQPDRATFVAADGAEHLASDSVDVVVSNPPFHQGHAVDHGLAERLLADAARVLRPQGRLVAVGQRDLHLHTRLRRWFRSVRVLSKHPVFVVVEASDPK